jgi:signal transduction histidine kinase
MTVRHRLAFTFVLLGFMLAVPSFFAAARLGALRDLAVRERARHAEAALAIGRMQAGLAELDRYARSYVAAPDEELRESVFGALRELRDELTRLDDAGFEDAVGPFQSEVRRLEEGTQVVDSLVLVGRLDAATESFFAIQRGIREARAGLEALATAVDERAAADFRRAEQLSTSSRDTTLLSVLGGLVLGALLSVWTARALWAPLERLQRALSQVADGDYTAPVDLPYEQKGELGELSTSFRGMAQRLAELDQLKAEFLAVAGHELKTPINVIRGYTELIEEELSGEVTTHQREILDGIAEQTRSMTRMVSHLMDISRLEAGDFPMERERVLLEDLLLGLQRSAEVLARRRGIELTVEILPDAPDEVHVDVDLVRDEVLGNIVSNALRFTPDDGHIRIRAWAQDGGVTIEVADSGPGIPDDHRPHVFEKYYQAERSRAMGSGLGLAIAREVVEVHGGRIHLADDVDGELSGAVFRVWLPAPAPLAAVGTSQA